MLTDVSVWAGQTMYSAHRLVLALSSSYFRWIYWLICQKKCPFPHKLKTNWNIETLALSSSYVRWICRIYWFVPENFVVDINFQNWCPSITPHHDHVKIFPTNWNICGLIDLIRKSMTKKGGGQMMPQSYQNNPKTLDQLQERSSPKFGLWMYDPFQRQFS